MSKRLSDNVKKQLDTITREISAESGVDGNTKGLYCIDAELRMMNMLLAELVDIEQEKLDLMRMQIGGIE